jgi:hypothetical protein
VNQIGKAIQKKFKGKPVGEAIGRILGDIKIEQRGGGESEGEAPPSKKDAPKAKPDAGGSEQGEAEEPEDPEIEELLR